MEDNNNNEYSDLINDNPPKEEKLILEEKPYYDETSPQTSQILNNNNQSQIDNNNFPSQDNLKQENESISSEVPYYDTQKNKNTNQFEHNILEQSIKIKKNKKNKKEENPKKLMILNIIIIFIVTANSILEIVFGIFSPYILGDDIIAIVYLVLIGRKMPTNHSALVLVTAFVGFIGFGIKIFGLTQANGKYGFIIPIFSLNIGISLAMIYCIQSCKCNCCSS